MAYKPYYTSNDLIDAVKRKIMLPLSQETFVEDDILAFANEEMMISLIPSVLEYHEEYFVFPVEVPLTTDTSRYSIPDRAIGSKMRDLSYKDTQGNLYEMTRIDPGDKAFYQRNVGANTAIHKFYIEGNDVVLLPEIVGDAQGSLVFFVFLRPNQLVQDSRAAIINTISTTSSETKKNFLANSTFIQIAGTNTITISGHGFTDGNRVTFSTTGTLPDGLDADTTYYVVNAATNTFQVSESLGGSAVSIADVGTGLHTVTRSKELEVSVPPEDINFYTNTITAANHDFANGDRVLVTSTDTLPTPLEENTFYYVVGAATNTFQLSTSYSGSAIDITYSGEGRHTFSSDITSITFDSIPDNITNGDVVDFLQTKSGHRTYAYDVEIPSNGVSDNVISFAADDVPSGLVVGDYVCLANECIIPQIPSDLHNGLAERTSARILAALGDQAGLQAAQQKIGEIEARQGTLLDSRAEGAPLKVTARHSLLRYGRFFGRRRV